MSKSILEFPLIARTRKNHGLEHATIHILSKKYPNVSLGGISTPKGFTIIGNVPTEDVAEAAIEALKRLRAGEAELAQHPNCGTNYVISGIFAGFGAWLGVVGTGKGFGKKVQRLPIMMFLATLALILTRRLGPIVQKEITTSSDPGEMELVRVETSLQTNLKFHHIVTKG